MNRIVPAGCLTADPPWQHNDKATKKGAHWGGAENHYETMSADELCRMVIPVLADDCWLFLWRLHTHHLEALAIAEAWGFNPKPCSELVWVKQTKDGSKPRMGMGHSLRMAHEVCLLFKRGKPKRASAGIASVIQAPNLGHSRKPDLFYETVDRFVGGVPRVELFARRHWPNWRCLGRQLEAAE